MTYTFNFVEEYIEFMAGRIGADGKTLTPMYYSNSAQPAIINLARYDVDIVNSFADQTYYGKNPYTDKQAALALRLINNYRRQLSKLIQVPEVLDQFKYGIRKYDRSRSMSLADEKIVIRFPYDEPLVKLFRNQNKEGTGAAHFDHDKKVWLVSLTENTLNWAVTLGQHYNFEISAELMDLYALVLEVEVAGHKIELHKSGDRYSISNADPSLIDYIEENLGGFELTNLLTLADNAETLGYTLSDEITEQIIQQYPGRISDFILKRKSSLKYKGSYLEEILSYARLVNRLPVHVYDTMAQNKKLDNSDVEYLKSSFGDPLLRPKLLVSTTPIIMGNKKQAWFTRAEKIIHISQ